MLCAAHTESEGHLSKHQLAGPPGLDCRTIDVLEFQIRYQKSVGALALRPSRGPPAMLNQHQLHSQGAPSARGRELQ